MLHSWIILKIDLAQRRQQGLSNGGGARLLLSVRDCSLSRWNAAAPESTPAAGVGATSAGATASCWVGLDISKMLPPVAACSASPTRRLLWLGPESLMGLARRFNDVLVSLPWRTEYGGVVRSKCLEEDGCVRRVEIMWMEGRYLKAQVMKWRFEWINEVQERCEESVLIKAWEANNGKMPFHLTLVWSSPTQVRLHHALPPVPPPPLHRPSTCYIRVGHQIHPSIEHLPRSRGYPSTGQRSERSWAWRHQFSPPPVSSRNG